MHLKQAQRLSELFQKQLAALDKRRGRGQQKVTVEHVTVAAGGQAIVGNIEAEQLRGSSGAQTNQTKGPVASVRQRKPTTRDGFSQ